MRHPRQFTACEVRFIRGSPWRVRQLARFFECNPGIISLIMRGYSYKDVTWTPEHQTREAPE
jgi:hypothetical protein